MRCSVETDFGRGTEGMSLTYFLINPGINYINPTALKVLHVSGGEGRAAGASDRGNDRVALADATTCSASNH